MWVAAIFGAGSSGLRHLEVRWRERGPAGAPRLLSPRGPAAISQLRRAPPAAPGLRGEGAGPGPAESTAGLPLRVLQLGER